MCHISIIIPTRNEQDNIGLLLGDLNVPELSGAEIILVDGQSTDKTREIARPYVDKVLESPPGRARQILLGVASVDSTWIWILHADTRVDLKAIAALLSITAEDSAVWGRFNVVILGRSKILRIISWLMNLRSCLTGVATGDQGMFMRLAAYKRVGGIPQYELMEDVALSKRLKAVAKPLCLRATLTTSGRRWQSQGVWKTVFLMWGLRLAWWLGVSDKTLARWYR